MTPHRILLGLVAVLASCLSSPTSAGEAGGKKYIYSNLGMRDGVCGVFEGRTESRFPAAIKTVIDTNPDSRRRAPRGTYFGCHSGSALLECEDGPYYCFRTSAVHFAVPKERGLHVGQRWTSMGNTFEVIRTEGIAYLGTRLETFVVATQTERNHVLLLVGPRWTRSVAVLDAAKRPGVRRGDGGGRCAWVSLLSVRLWP